MNLVDGFDFQDQRFLDHDIELIMSAGRSISIDRRQLPLAGEGQTCFRHFDAGRAWASRQGPSDGM